MKRSIGRGMKGKKEKEGEDIKVTEDKKKAG